MVHLSQIIQGELIMKIIQNEHVYKQLKPCMLTFIDDNSVFLDIETTGLSSKKNQIYLIGCAKRINHVLHATQYFCESPIDEPILLKQFLEDISQASTIITFNGTGFDIPFIQARCSIYSIPESISQIKHYDLYRLITKYKSIFQLNNYKQKTIESFLGLEREDQFSGGQLVDVYFNYLKNKSTDEEQLLLLHNYEDVIHMFDLLPMFSYLALFEGNFQVIDCIHNTYLSYDNQNCEELFLTINYEFEIPKPIIYNHNDIYLRIEQKKTTIRIPIIAKEMYHFFPDYKNYYYLPTEDQAIHKSVSQFVDSSHRIQACASNCYTKKKSKFLPQFSNLFSPVFQDSFKSKTFYFEFSKSFMDNYDDLYTYIKQIFCILTKKTDHI